MPPGRTVPPQTRTLEKILEIRLMVWCEQRLRLWKSGRSVRHLDTLMTRNCPNFGVHHPEDSESLPVQFKPKFRFEKTNLLARVVEKWDEIPVGFLQDLDLRKSV